MKYRASYTVLSLWKSGQWERAIKTYFKLDQFTTREMQDGKEYHEQWKEEIIKTGRLPEVFGGAPLTNPIPENKYVVSIQDWIDLVFIVDCIDAPVLHEFKTGKQSSEAYAGDDLQTSIYAVGTTLLGHYVNKAIYHHYDQYTKRAENSTVWITDAKLEDAHNQILTLGSEMHDYLEKNGLYEQFGKRL